MIRLFLHAERRASFEVQSVFRGAAGHVLSGAGGHERRHPRDRPRQVPAGGASLGRGARRRTAHGPGHVRQARHTGACKDPHAEGYAGGGRDGDTGCLPPANNYGGFPFAPAHGRACTCERCVASDGNKVCPKRTETDMDRRFTFVRLGYSYRVGEIEGALGLGQLERVDEIMGSRHKNADYLIKGLEHLEKFIQLPRHPDNIEHTYMMFPVLVKRESPVSKNELVKYLESENIETRPMLPLLNQPIYKKIFGDIEKNYPNAEYIDNNGFYIGCHHGLSKDDLDREISIISRIYKTGG